MSGSRQAGSRVRRMGWILLAGLGLGAGVHLFRGPERLAWSGEDPSGLIREANAAGIGRMGRETLVRMSGGGATLLDARPLEDYRKGHIPGALPFPASDGFDALMRHADVLMEASWIGVYCSGAWCDEGLRVGRLLRESGFSDVRLYVGGYEEWSARGGRIDISPEESP